MAAELIQRQVTVIVAFSTPAARAAKAATTTIPIVFTTNRDPVEIGLVASLNRPGGNMTGATNLSVEVEPKLVELVHDAVPSAKIIAALVNPTNFNPSANGTGPTSRDVRIHGESWRVSGPRLGTAT